MISISKTVIDEQQFIWTDKNKEVDPRANQQIEFVGQSENSDEAIVASESMIILTIVKRILKRTEIRSRKCDSLDCFKDGKKNNKKKTKILPRRFNSVTKDGKLWRSKRQNNQCTTKQFDMYIKK